MVVADYENALVSKYKSYNLERVELKLVAGGLGVEGKFERTQELPLQEVDWKLVLERKWFCRTSLKSIIKRFAKSDYCVHQPVVTIWSGVCDNTQT